MSEHISNDIRAVFFDHDDTLFGTMKAKWTQHKFIAREYYNKDLTDAEIMEHWGKPLSTLACLLYGTTDKAEARDHLASCHKEYPKELFDSTIPTLRHLKAAGKMVGIITATSRFSFEHDLELHGIPPELIDYTQTEEDTPFHKPDERVFDPALAWLQEQDVQPEEVLYVGDGLHDMKAALGAGFNFLGVETGLVTADQFKDAGAHSIPHVGFLATQHA